MIDENWRDEVLELAQKYCEEQGIMLTTLGGRIVNDADFFPHLKNGGGCTADKLVQVMNWLNDNAPKNGAQHG